MKYIYIVHVYNIYTYLFNSKSFLSWWKPLPNKNIKFNHWSNMNSSHLVFFSFFFIFDIHLYVEFTQCSFAFEDSICSCGVQLIMFSLLCSVLWTTSCLFVPFIIYQSYCLFFLDLWIQILKPFFPKLLKSRSWNT